MQKIAIITTGESSQPVATVIGRELGATPLARTDVAAQWAAFDAFVFVGAMGICVRTIAPCVADKHTDPAVVCVDSSGRHAVAVLSGHVGGANDLARTVAAAVGAHPVITTQSDNAGLWALDTLASRFGWRASTADLNPVIIPFVAGRQTALLLQVRDAGTDFLERTRPPHVTLVSSLAEVSPARFAALVVVTAMSPASLPPVPTVVYYVPALTVGIGLARDAGPVEAVDAGIRAALSEAGLQHAVKDYATIDVKAAEPYVALLQQRGERVAFFTADELALVSVPTPSSVVQRHVGTPSVSEAAALLASGGGELLLTKVKGPNFTVAVAIGREYLRRGHVEIVGAGPGDPDLVSVRGRRLLERADLILYAGSLVPRALTDCAKAGAVVRSSASMALDEQCSLMKDFYDRGAFIVRLHTGDPCIFGAIQEQMAFFDRHAMSYHITPGISSFLAAAAELRSQFTIPGRTQTIILTRGEGRTPMPPREQLRLLARSQSTMCIFLSAAIVDQVQAELLEEYPEDTPVAACYHLTWPDQRIYRGRLKDLASLVHDNHLTLTTMLVVGEAIDNRHGLSELYNKHFTHLYRQGAD